MKLMIATPTGSGDVCHEYVSSLVGTIADLNSKGVAVDLRFWPGSCYVALARNELARMFMASDCDKLLFIDADMGFAPDGAWKLIQANRDFVCGLYRYKTPEEAYPSWVDTDDKGFPIVESGMVSLSMAPTGFMMLSRWVFESYRIRFPEAELAAKDGEPPLWDYFPQGRVGKTWWGEDSRFCQLWKESGGQIWAVPDIEFVHVGKQAFKGNWHEYAQRLPGGRKAAA